MIKISKTEVEAVLNADCQVNDNDEPETTNPEYDEYIVTDVRITNGEHVHTSAARAFTVTSARNCVREHVHSLVEHFLVLVDDNECDTYKDFFVTRLAEPKEGFVVDLHHRSGAKDKHVIEIFGVTP